MQEEMIDAFTRIKRKNISTCEVEGFTSESQFIGKLVDLLIEAGSFLITASSVYPSGKNGWSRNEAVIGGSLVRLYKLIESILDQTCKHRLEVAFILSRLHFETSVNILYLMQRPSHENFESYVQYSLQYENELLKTIEANIQSRGGESQPIEDRMIISIQRAFDTAQVDRSNLPVKRIRDWGNKNFKEKTRLVGLEDAYLGVFKNSSLVVHGNWSDLYQHHLKREDGRFFAKHSFKFPRPQYLEVNALMTVKVVSEFIDFLGMFQERIALRSIFTDFEDRLSTLTQLHESFIQRE